MTPKENCNENLPKSISGIFGKKFMGTHCNALLGNNMKIELFHVQKISN
jgi:hypothetical protein